MKFLLCLVLCFAAAQAGLVGVPSALTYASPYAYSAGIAPLNSVYTAPVAYAGYPTAYSTLGAPLVRTAYAAPSVLAAPSVYTTLLKK